MATVPLSGTNIRLLSGVPFNNDYKHTRWFDSLDQQTAWFQSKPVLATATDHNYQRKDGRIKIGKGIDELWGANYLMFQNTTYNNKWFYAFVTKLEYVNKETTYVYFDIDVIQTWMFDFDFQPSYVIREHMDQLNSDGTVMTHHQEEGLDYGTDYDVVHVEKFVPYYDVFFLVIVAKQPLHTDSNYGITKGQISTRYNGVPTPLVYYCHPFRFTEGATGVDLSDGTTLSNLTDVLTALYSNTTSVNDIVSLYITDYLGFNCVTMDTNLGTSVELNDNYLVKATITGDNSNTFTTLYYAGDLQYSPLTHDFGDKYQYFNDVTETKLKMWPYCVISLEDFKGNRVDFKPEYIYDTNLKVTVRGSMGTDNKVAYSIDAYNTSGLSTSDAQTVSIESSLIDNTPNDVPILADMLSAYLQGNRNSIRMQKANAIFHGVTGGINAGFGVLAGAMTGSPMAIGSSVVQGVESAGDSVLKIQSIQAKQQDINNQPPQLVSMGSNSAFDYGNGWQGIYIVKRQIKKEYRDKLTDFFNMYGYKSNHVKVPALHTRENWNYVQTQSCYITGNFNNEDEQDIRKVFDNGITLWHTDDMGNYSLTNGVIS